MCALWRVLLQQERQQASLQQLCVAGLLHHTYIPSWAAQGLLDSAVMILTSCGAKAKCLLAAGAVGTRVCQQLGLLCLSGRRDGLEMVGHACMEEWCTKNAGCSGEPCRDCLRGSRVCCTITGLDKGLCRKASTMA